MEGDAAVLAFFVVSTIDDSPAPVLVWVDGTPEQQSSHVARPLHCDTAVRPLLSPLLPGKRAASERKTVSPVPQRCPTGSVFARVLFYFSHR